MEHPGLYLPAVRVLGHSYRVRLRLNGWKGFRRRVEYHPRSTVHTLRAGWLLIVTLVRPI